MKYCTNCGQKLEENDKYCTGCGSKVIKEKEPQNYILILGVFLVLFASFLFGFLSWKIMVPELRITFFAVECVLFFGLSYILKKAATKFDRLFFIIGLILIPYTLSLVPYYGLISSYLASGTGLYVYLAICYFLTTVIYLMINSKFKSVVLNYLSIVSLLISFICTALIFNNSEQIITVSILAYLLMLHVLSYVKIFSEKFRKILMNFSVIASYVLIPYILYVNLNSSTYDIIPNAVTLLLFILNTYLKLFIDKNSVFIYITPFVLPFIYISFAFTAFQDETIFIYLITVIAVALYIISSIINKRFKLLTMIMTYVQIIGTVLFLFLVSFLDGSYVQDICIVLIITLVLNFINTFIYKYKVINYFIPINIFLIVVTLTKWIGNIDYINVILATSSIFLIVYAALKIFNSKYAYSYLITGGLMTLLCLTNTMYDFELINILIPIIYSIMFILTIVFKEKNFIKVPVYVLLNVSVILVFNDFNGIYTLMAISGVTLLSTMLISLYTKVDLKPYILYGEILVILVTLINMIDATTTILLYNTLLYVLAFISVVKYFNIKFYRIIYIILGFLLINSFIYTLIEPVVIYSIVSIISMLIIIIVLYLADIENGVVLSIVSLVTLIPYYILVFSEFSSFEELFLLPFIIYTIVFTEIINFKDTKSKNIATLIPLCIISYSVIQMSYLEFEPSIRSIIFDLLLGTLYIILGTYRKFNTFIFIGIGLIVVILLIRLFTIMNSIGIVIALIIIGFILIGISVYFELKKEKNKNISNN